MARVTLSTTLLIGAVTLVGAIVVGESMGNHVIGSIARLTSSDATPIAVPSTDASIAPRNWKHESLIAVATDPGFPDPRITPPPPPPPPPPPTPRPYVPTARPTLAPLPTVEPEPTDVVPYTSPPLPVPLVSSDPSATPTSAVTAEPTATPTPRRR